MRQYRGQRQIVSNQWAERTKLMEAYSDETLVKLSKMHGLLPASSRGEIVFAILEREYPMPDLKRFGLTPFDIIEAEQRLTRIEARLGMEAV